LSRRFPDRPIAGVGAVILDGDRVLLARRGHPPLEGEWSLPGGAVEVGETLREGLMREVLEETGLTVEVGPVIEVLDRIERNSDDRVEYHFVIVDYLCSVRGGTLACASDASDARWVRLDDLADYSLTEAALRVIRRGAAASVSTENTPARRAGR
jgi:8-oxo-dGTP diphosphatase